MARVSVTEVITRLPSIDVVRERCLAMAALDAIMSPEWDFRYFSYDPNWSTADQMASMRDGSGNEYSIVFTREGAWARGFDHESAMSPYRTSPPELWPGLLEGLPEVFRAQVREPAFCDQSGVLRATVCFWRENSAAGWTCGTPAALSAGQRDDGSAEWLFEVLLDGGAEGYRTFAEEYYEAEVDLEAVSHVYALNPLTSEVVARLSPSTCLTDVVDELRGMGYPVVAA